MIDGYEQVIRVYIAPGWETRRGVAGAMIQCPVCGAVVVARVRLPGVAEYAVRCVNRHATSEGHEAPQFLDRVEIVEV